MCFIIAVSCYEIYISIMNATAWLSRPWRCALNRVSTDIPLSAVHSYDLLIQSLPVLPCSCLWSHFTIPANTPHLSMLCYKLLRHVCNQDLPGERNTAAIQNVLYKDGRLCGSFAVVSWLQKKQPLLNILSSVNHDLRQHISARNVSPKWQKM